MCCDVCHPVSFPVATVPIKGSRSKRKMKVTNFTMDEYDLRLRDGLNEWREQQLEDEGRGGDDFFGPEVLMSNDVRNRIVDLAHHGKIQNVKTLEEQTGWQYALHYGLKVFELINIYSRPHTLLPSAPPASQVFQGIDTNIASQLPTEGKRLRTCGACGSDKHIRASVVVDLLHLTNCFLGSNKLCPNWRPIPVKNENEQDENCDTKGLLTPAAVSSAGPSQSSTERIAKKPRTCGACGATGHIRTSSMCPQWKPLVERRTMKEEIPGVCP